MNGSDFDTKDMDIGWKKPDVPRSGATVGERIEYSLAEAVRRVLSLFDEPLAELLAWSVRLIIKVVEKSTASYVKPVLDHAIKSMDEGDPIREMLEEIRTPTGEGALALLAGVGASAGTAGLMSVFEPYFERWRQNAYLGTPTKLPDLLTLMALHRRGALTDAQRDEYIQRLGYEKKYWEPIWEAVRTRPGMTELLESVRRGDLDIGEMQVELVNRGMSEDEAFQIAEFVQVIPGPTDQIRMAVREAFDPSIIERFGLHQELHKVPFDTLAKVGLSEEWAKAYWAAHWEIPSITMAYEMLHRGVIDKETLELLLATQDISPTWRDPLIEISYRPFTRVDVRRMYDLGILDEDAVKRSYLDLGYDSTKAEDMTAFTIAYYQESERQASRTDITNAYIEAVIARDEAASLLSDLGYLEDYIETYLLKADYTIAARLRREDESDEVDEFKAERALTKSDILSSYLEGIMTEGEASGALTDLGYPSDLADFLTAKTDYKRVQNLIREAITTTKTLYINEEIGIPDIHSRLGQYALPATQVDELLTLWNIEKERRVERPSVTKLIDFYITTIIDEVQLKEQLQKHKLSPEYIDWYLADASLTVLEKERKEEERVRKEQERIRKSRFKTDRMVELNRLDVIIQQYKVYIAELKVAALYAVDVNVKQQIKERIVESQAEIVRLQLEKVEYPVTPGMEVS